MSGTSETDNSLTNYPGVMERCGGDAFEACRTCDECASTCFLTPSYPDMPPPAITRAILEDRIQDIVDSEFLWACTLCTRCTVDCPKGLHMDEIMRSMRGIARTRGNGPKRLEDGLAKIKETGNSVGFDAEEFTDTIQWLGEEAAEEVEGLDPDEFQVPVDKEGAEFLYVPNPREFTSTPHMFSVYLRFFTAIGADWTYASNVCDVSNWAYYMGDEESNLEFVRNIVDTARGLGVKTVISTECGHGFKILRKDAERMIGEPLGFEVMSVVDLAYRYFREGRLGLRQGAVDHSVTYHDPCNVSRKLGAYEEPRVLLKHICREFVEMEPYGRYGLCCGGGGGTAQNSDMGKKRLENAKGKRDQIVATGADVVSSSCQACLAQLGDMKVYYDLPVEIKSVIELVVESLKQ